MNNKGSEIRKMLKSKDVDVRYLSFEESPLSLAESSSGAVFMQ
jgi:hypothetical protein